MFRFDLGKRGEPFDITASISLNRLTDVILHLTMWQPTESIRVGMILCNEVVTPDLSKLKSPAFMIDSQEHKSEVSISTRYFINHTITMPELSDTGPLINNTYMIGRWYNPHGMPHTCQYPRPVGGKDKNEKFIADLTNLQDRLMSTHSYESSCCILCDAHVSPMEFVATLDGHRYSWLESYQHYLVEHRVVPDPNLVKLVNSLSHNHTSQSPTNPLLPSDHSQTTPPGGL